MQSDKTRKTIDGFEYTILMLDPLEASDMLVDLNKMLVPTMAVAAGAVASTPGGIKEMLDGKGAMGASVGKAISQGLVTFVEALDKQTLRSWIDTLSRVTSVRIDGKDPQLNNVFNNHFRGRLGAMYKWLAFALEAQFSDFLSSFKDAIGHVVRQAEVLSSPSTSPDIPQSSA